MTASHADRFILGAHYYRPPFPLAARWREDLARVRAAGLNTIQLWVTWAWVEAEPGRHRFEDYDELLDLAHAAGLGVVLSTVAELQPEWIHRLEPGATMIDHLGRAVPSCHRIESNQGLTPGGCTDHAGLWARMERFLRATAEHFRGHPAVVAWDVWNELRWNIHATGYVCHCAATLAAFRAWLAARHGDLDGLNRAWHRRYADWSDVQPGRGPGHPYAEQLAFTQFLQERAEAHLRARVAVFRAAGVPQPVIAHGPAPTLDQPGNPELFQTPVCRGNDAVHARALDGYGVSHFPLWGRQDDIEFAVRVNASADAAGERTLWLAELQGGAANYGHEIAPPVTAELLRRWLWLGVAAGARAVLFWSWRDEVFGREATGFGLAGHDGQAPARLALLENFARVLERRHAALLSYRPQPADIGVWFDARNYHLEAAESGRAVRTRDSLRGYLRACERLHRPARLVDATQPDALDGLRLLILPCAPIITPEAAARLRDFVARGGTLLLEAETDSWSADGFYRAEPEERAFVGALGLACAGRRPASAETVDLEAGGRLRFAWFRAPWIASEEWRVLARDAAGEALVLTRSLGRGCVVACGGFAGLAYAETPDEDFERWVEALAGERSEALSVAAPASVRVGQGACAEGQLVFLVNSADASATIALGGATEDLETGELVEPGFTLAAGACRVLLRRGGR